MTYAEQLRQEGRQQVRQEILQEKFEMVKELLKAVVKEDIIAKSAKLTIKEIEKIKKELALKSMN